MIQYQKWLKVLVVLLPILWVWTSVTTPHYHVKWVMMGVICIGTVCQYYIVEQLNITHHRQIKRLYEWLLPSVSMVGTPMMMRYFSIDTVLQSGTPIAWLGLFVTIISSFMAQLPYQGKIGLKLPWTMSSESNWTYTHRLLAQIWRCTGSVLMVLGTLNLNYPFVTNALMLIAILTPVVASIQHSAQHHTK